MTARLCKVCRGAGNIGVYPDFWRCCACGGAGVTAQFGPARIATGGRKSGAQT